MAASSKPEGESPSREDDKAHLARLLAHHVALEEQLRQAFLIELHGRGLASIDDIYREAGVRARPPKTGFDPPESDNVQVAPRWNQELRERIGEVTLEYTARLLSREAIDDIVNLNLKQQRAQALEELANTTSVSYLQLADEVRSFCRLPIGRATLAEEDSVSVRLALIRRFISEQLDFQKIAKHHLRIRDFDELLGRTIGDDKGHGLIGGKAAGLLLGAKILQSESEEGGRGAKTPVGTPESFYLRSDTMEQFLRKNGLYHLQDHKYRDIDRIRNDYPMLRDLFKNGKFPDQIVTRLAALLVRIGPHPLIVRSSSLLEDRIGTSFAGKYRSVFVINQGTPQERLEELLGAVAEVYASSLHPDPISYRRRHDLLDFDESMAVLIQRIVGRRMGRFFLPVWAGVAFSMNPYRRNPRIRPEDGMARVVFGLGTRAVDRVSRDMPRIVPLGMPTLRPEVTAEDVIRVAQDRVDLVNLEEGRFETRTVADVLAEHATVPGLAHVFSTYEHGAMRPMAGDGLAQDPQHMVVTMDHFAGSSPFPALIRRCLTTLEQAYNCPVDIEFAYDGAVFHLLQCRPQAVRMKQARVQIPQGISESKVVFSAHRDVVAGSVDQIEFVVLIDPQDYNALTSDDKRGAIGMAVRALNHRLENKRFVLMGPGRWGSRDLRMGVRVTYSDIDNACMLIEIARRQGDYVPEVSYGSHFFQDLVESNTHYLALYPDEKGVAFNEEFLRHSPNALAKLVPELKELTPTVRVIHVPTVAKGWFLRVDMDEDLQHAVGYLAEPPEKGETPSNGG